MTTTDAGDFSSWLAQIAGAIRGEHGSDVPCGECTACCQASQFVHIGPDETDTLAQIPAELLFPAPGLPRGHVLMGYDERGHCPMLIDNACSIYEHRPRTCRTYDCRIFPSAGLDVAESDPDKAGIAERARSWRFSYASTADETRHGAVRAAAAYVEVHAGELIPATVPTTTTQRAVLAIEIHEQFLGPGRDEGTPVVIEPALESVRVEVRRGFRSV